MARSVRVGAVLVALYVAVAAATTSWAPGRMRPLFDGFGSHPGQYYWVDPPREFAEGNQRPESAESTVRFEGGTSQAASAGPNDGQALVGLPPGVVPANPPDTEATVRLEPVDAVKLGALPTGLRPEGNAYRVEIEFDSGLKVVALEKPASVGLTSAAPADTLLYSLDGKAWETLTGQPLGTNNGITGPLAATGYYLAAAKGPLREMGGPSGSGATIVLVVAALAVPVALAWLFLSRRRPAAKGGKKQAGGRPTVGGRRGQGGQGTAKAKGPGQAKGPRQAKGAGQATGSGPAKGSGQAKGSGSSKGGGGPEDPNQGKGRTG